MSVLVSRTMIGPRGAAAAASIQRYGLKLVGRKPFKLSADPRERDLSRRSGEGGAMTPWLIIGGLLLLGVVAYVVFALI